MCMQFQGHGKNKNMKNNKKFFGDTHGNLLLKKAYILIISITKCAVKFYMQAQK